MAALSDYDIHRQYCFIHQNVLLPKLICDMNNKKKSQKYPKKKSWETNLVSL